MPDITIAVHGGAGKLPGEDRIRARRQGLAGSLRAGLGVLEAGGPALDAVVEAVCVLEDHEEFNAGRGSVPTTAGTVEMDAAVADGSSRRAGAVAAVRGVRHPVAAARAVLDDGRHVLLAGTDAAGFARSAGVYFETDDWFLTPRWRSDGTVGAVARDRSGHLAAATSTGGRTGQIPGRVGDSPVIGAGTWADDRTCAISATGDGEVFLRLAFAHEIDALVRLAGCTLEEACRRALERVFEHGGAGGCVALDRTGRLAMPFTTEAMDRGWASGSETLWLGCRPGALIPG